MRDNSVNISVTQHQDDPLTPFADVVMTMATGGLNALFGASLSTAGYDATVTIGDQTYSGSGKTYDEAVEAAKHEAGID